MKNTPAFNPFRRSSTADALRSSAHFILGIICLTAVVSGAFAQTLFTVVTSAATAGLEGISVASAADFDNDGFVDLLHAKGDPAEAIFYVTTKTEHSPKSNCPKLRWKHWLPPRSYAPLISTVTETLISSSEKRSGQRAPSCACSISLATALPRISLFRV